MKSGRSRRCLQHGDLPKGATQPTKDATSMQWLLLHYCGDFVTHKIFRTTARRYAAYADSALFGAGAARVAATRRKRPQCGDVYLTCWDQLKFNNKFIVVVDALASLASPIAP